MLAFARELGLDLAALQTFSKCLYSPPITQNSFGKYLRVTKAVAEESMKEAATQLIDAQDGNHGTMVSEDKSWQYAG